MERELLFSLVWREYIMSLEGEEISTLGKGYKNRIVEVTENYIRRVSSKGILSSIKIDKFRDAFFLILDKKEMSRTEINTKIGGRCSSFLIAVLAKVPFLIDSEEPLNISIKKNYIL